MNISHSCTVFTVTACYQYELLCISLGFSLHQPEAHEVIYMLYKNLHIHTSFSSWWWSLSCTVHVFCTTWWKTAHEAFRLALKTDVIPLAGSQWKSFFPSFQEARANIRRYPQNTMVLPRISWYYYVCDSYAFNRQCIWSMTWLV